MFGGFGGPAPATPVAVAAPVPMTTPPPAMVFPQTTLHLISPPGPPPGWKLVPATPPTVNPMLAYTVPPIAVEQMRSEITELRNEVAASNKDMWNAVKLITSTVEK